jgi:hypothetical protein
VAYVVALAVRALALRAVEHRDRDGRVLRRCCGHVLQTAHPLNPGQGLIKCHRSGCLVVHASAASGSGSFLGGQLCSSE